MLTHLVNTHMKALVSIGATSVGLGLMIAAMGFVPWVHMDVAFGASVVSSSHIGLLSLAVPKNDLFPFPFSVSLKEYTSFADSAGPSLGSQPSLQPLVDYGALAFAGLTLSCLLSGLALLAAALLALLPPSGSPLLARAAKSGVLVSLLGMVAALGSVLVWLLVAINGLSYAWGPGPWLVVTAVAFQFLAFISLASAIRSSHTPHHSYDSLIARQSGPTNYTLR